MNDQSVPAVVEVAPGMFSIRRYADVKAVLLDHQNSSARVGPDTVERTVRARYRMWQ